MRVTCWILASSLSVVILATDAAASEVVQFADGRTLRVAGLVAEGEALRLSLEGGGTIVVPAWRVVGWRPIAAEPQRQLAGAQQPRVTRWRSTAGMFADPIARAARVHRLDPALLTAMAEVESSFDPAAVSPKGAQGLLQLMPATAERFGVDDAFDPSQNVDGGARYLSWLLRRFEGRTDLALAGYNAGEAAVERFNGVPPYRETRNYVEKVMAGAARLRDAGRATAAPLRGAAASP